MSGVNINGMFAPKKVARISDGYGKLVTIPFFVTYSYLRLVLLLPRQNYERPLQLPVPDGRLFKCFICHDLPVVEFIFQVTLQHSTCYYIISR